MAIHPKVTLLVRDLEKSAQFYERSLGYTRARKTLLIGPYGQSLRILEAAGEMTGSRLALNIEVPDMTIATEAIMQNGGTSINSLLDGALLYTGPDGELLMLSQRGINGASKIKLIVYDFDGVMTDNRVYVDQNGIETVAANRGDGMGTGFITRLGIEQLILSTEKNEVVKARARKLGIEAAHGIHHKSTVVKQLAATKGVELKDVLYVGNDVNDANAMKLCGFKVAPADAHPAILAIADYVTEAKGGFGVIRELADVLNASFKAEELHT